MGIHEFLQMVKGYQLDSWQKKNIFHQLGFSGKIRGISLTKPPFLEGNLIRRVFSRDEIWPGWMTPNHETFEKWWWLSLFHHFHPSKTDCWFQPTFKNWIKLTLFKKRADLEIDSKRKTKSNAWIHQLDSNTKKLRNCLSQIPSQRRLYIVYSIQQTDIGVSMRFVWPDILDYSSTSSTLKLLRSHNHLQAQAIQNISPTKNRLVKVLEL